MGRATLLLTLLLPAVVSAAPRGIVTGPGKRVLARQAVSATGVTRAQSRVIYLDPNDVILRPGENDSSRDISSLVEEPTQIEGWDIDADTWDETVACMREIYAPFDVTITDEDPGSVPHIEAHFGDSPASLDLPENVAGVSPFTTDCAVIEHSIVFTFTDVLDDDPRTVCEVMAQEVAHSFGLDHEMLASDPMTYLPYPGERTFQDEMAACGEYGDRICGINGSVCRKRQNSYELLLDRLGPSQSGASPRGDDDTSDGEIRGGIIHGCNAAGGDGGMLLVLCYLVGQRVARRRTRDRGHRALLQRGSGHR